MSSSSSGTRVRVLRGASFRPGFSPLEAEIAPPAEPVDPAVAAAEERRGYDDGYRAGLAEGLAAGRAAMAAESATTQARLDAAVRSLDQAAADLRRRQALELTGLEDALARTAVDLASAIIGRELQVAESPGADALARALSLVPAGAATTARLNPADAALVTDPPKGVALVPDPAIEPGGCILEVGDSRIDAQLSSAVDRVRAALLGERA
ncbi:MAG TPA: FliH/SctL family protein [Acidimicrobiia bacterium]|nr:FliH/SctL family protein [Acidimicrobiia bacterium]